jgi:hypothetical protein
MSDYLRGIYMLLVCLTAEAGLEQAGYDGRAVAARGIVVDRRAN